MKQNLPENMLAIRQHKADGKLYVESLPLPQPGAGEVLIKMAAAPINPSDLALLKGGYMKRTYPFTPGLEGSGIIVASGGGLLAGLRIGKRVACSPNPEGDGTWAEYMISTVMRTIPLPSSSSMEQGAMMLVNPMTVLAFLNIAEEGKHRAMVNNAAASALGKMLIRQAAEKGIPLINIVRKEEDVIALKNMGASHVLNSADASFEADLTALAAELDASLFLDAVSGSMASLLLRAAPPGSKLLTYARFSGDPLSADPGELIRKDKKITGFLLGKWLQTKGILFKLKFIKQVKKQLGGTLSTHIHQSFDLSDVEEAIKYNREHTSLGKIILKLSQND